MNMILKTSLITAALLSAACTHSVSDKTSAAKTDIAIATDAAATPGVIKVNVDGFKVQQGVVAAALFNEAGYKGQTPQLRGQNVDVTSESVTLIFKDLPAGEYGIKMYHDVDQNGQMNTNAFGLPTEPYAFSNDAVGMMGPAKWDAAKFTVTEAGSVTTISFQ